MKKLSYIVTLTTIAAMMLIVSAAASSQQEHSGMAPASKPAQGKMSKDQPGMHGMMDMSTMKQEPHHLLAMAYKDNLVSFAKALHQGANQTKPVGPEFARAAVAEMRRSFDQMQQHHQAHMKTMDEKMTSQMADMMKQMDTHQAAIQEHLTALEKSVQDVAPDAKAVSEHVAAVLKQCEGMSKMHSGAMEHKMARPKDKKMAGPKDHKMN